MNATRCEHIQLTGGNKPADCDPVWNAIQAEALQHTESEQLLARVDTDRSCFA